MSADEAAEDRNRRAGAEIGAAHKAEQKRLADRLARFAEATPGIHINGGRVEVIADPTQPPVLSATGVAGILKGTDQ